MLLSGTLLRRRSQQAKGSDGEDADEGEEEFEEREEDDEAEEERDIMFTDDESMTVPVDVTDNPPLVVVGGGHRGVLTEIPSIIG